MVADCPFEGFAVFSGCPRNSLSLLQTRLATSAAKICKVDSWHAKLSLAPGRSNGALDLTPLRGLQISHAHSAWEGRRPQSGQGQSAQIPL